MTAVSRARRVGWAILLAVCFGLLLALTFKVNAVKSDVRLTERQIIAAQQSKLMLETEFETRASQQQLSDWNAVEFGYNAPRADQYLENERQLAVLGTPRGLGAPSPVRVALNRPAAEEVGVFDGWLADDEAQAETDRHPAHRELAATDLAERLASPAVGMVAVAEVAQ